VCRFLCVWRKRRLVFHRGKIRCVAILCLIVSNMAMVSCALIPMSCGCLIDGTDWVYVSWRDYVHDGSLWLAYASSITSAFLCGYHTAMHQKKRTLLYFTSFFAILQTIGIYRCPTSSDSERVALLALEVLAIALAQFMHYATVNHLVLDSPPSNH
jgi:hypothetical protein